MKVFNSDVNRCHTRPRLLPKVGHAVESRLLVEDVALCVHNNGAVHKVFNPVWPTSLVQCQVPVCPTHHVIIQVLKKTHKKKGRQKYSPYQSFLVRFVLCKWVCAAGGLGVSHSYISKFLLGPQMSECRLHRKARAQREETKKHKFQLVSLCHRQVSPRRLLAASCTLETCTAASGVGLGDPP